MRYHLRGIFLLLGLCLGLTLAGCGGLASEPGIVSTSDLPTVTPTAPPDQGFPAGRINLADGAQLFGGPQGCAACHGITGQGNGQVAAQFTCQIPDFTTADVNRSKTIGAWFGIVSNGNSGDTSCLMPPWKSRLNEQQRWDVTSYIYNLHYTQTLLAQGKTVWGNNCQSCHGPRGAGDGPQASAYKNLTNLGDPAALIKRSDTELFKVMQTPMSDGVHVFKDQLSDDQRWAVVAYMRSLSWDGVDQAISGTTPTPIATAAVTPTPAAVASVPDGPTVTVSGKVTNGSAGGAIPAGLSLTLREIETLAQGGFHDVNTLAATTAADGSFNFGDLPRQNGLIYAIVTQYAGVVQNGIPVQLATGSGPKLDLSFKVYDIAHDPGLIRMELQRVFVDFNGPNSALIDEGIRLRGTGDHIYLSDQKLTAAGNPLAVELALPTGAQNVQLSADSKPRFSLDGGVIQSSVPMLPGESTTVQFSYTLTFDGPLTISRPTLYPVDILSVALPQAAGATLQGSEFVKDQPVTLQTGVYDTYLRQKNIPAASQESFTILLPTAPATEQRNVLAVVLILGMLVLLGTVGAIILLTRRGDSARALPDSVGSTAIATEKLIQTIADLDDRFAAGKVSPDDYESERSRLKTELANLLTG